MNIALQSKLQLSWFKDQSKHIYKDPAACHKGTKKIFLKYEKLDCKFTRKTKDIKGDRFSLG